MLNYLSRLLNFEHYASLNHSNRNPLLKFVGFALILTSLSFAGIHLLFDDMNGTLFLLTIALLGGLALKITQFIGHTVSSHIYTSLLTLTIVYFHVSLDCALAAWFPLIPIAALLSSGWRSGLIWLSITLLIVTLIFLFPMDKNQFLVGYWSYIPEAYQAIDRFLVSMGAIIIISLLMVYVEIAREHAFTFLEQNRLNLKRRVKEEVANRLNEQTAHEQEIESTQKELILTMSTVLETRSNETGYHVQRVCEYSALMAKLLGLDEKEQELIYIAASMHDVGKVVVSDEILHKPSKLTPAEFAEMKRHAEVGYEMLKGSKRPIIQTAAEIALYHHEWWNGEGYPKQLKGEQIPLYARIVAIADVFDALGSERVYKKAWPLDDIFHYFKAGSGKQFDPKLVDLLMENSNDFLEIRNSLID